MSQPLQLPPATREKLLQLQRRIRRIKVAEGLLAGLFGLLLTYLLVFALDRWVETGAWLRAGLLAIGTLGLGVVFPLKCHRWVWGTRRMQQLALLVKRKFPSLGDQLLGVIELAETDGGFRASRTLAEAAIQQVDQAVRSRDLTVATPSPSHRQWSLAVAVPLGLVLLAALAVPAAGFSTLQRWAMPWAKIPRYTFVRIQPFPERLVAPHGETFAVQAQLSAASRWSPGTAKAHIPGQPQLRAALHDGAYEFEIPPQTESTALQLRVGDYTTPVELQVAARPELRTLLANVELPAYLQYPPKTSADVRSGVLTTLRGAQVGFEGEASRSLARATLQGKSLPIAGTRLMSPAGKVAESGVLEFQWQDELGLESKNGFQLKLNLVDDSAPRVSLQLPDTLQVLLETDVLRLEVQAQDDFGVRQIGLEWQGIAHPVHNPHPDRGEKLVRAGAPEKLQLEGSGTFSAQSDNVRPQLLEVRAFAEDYLPARERVYSPPVVVQVMSAEAHAIWMMSQMRRWVSLAQDVYEEEQRLHDDNRRFRRLSPEQLNAPDTRRQIEQQAAAERANAARLESVSKQGTELIEQALRNPAMLAPQLETWAQGLQKLQEIAQRRMPSVADLLTQAANAPAGNPGESQVNSASAPNAGMNRGRGQAGPPKENDAANSNPNVPQVTDVESGHNPPAETPPSEGAAGAPGQPRLGLPQTTVQGGPQPAPAAPQPQPAGENVQEAIGEQADLLADFEKVRDDLNQVLSGLENSTFVKRLKAASREQLDVANSLSRTLFDGFGRSKESLPAGQLERYERIATREEGQGKLVRAIQSDMEAYFGRRGEEKLQRIAQEMDTLNVAAQLTELGTVVREGRAGDAIVRAEFWSDVLDRWAEEMVAASQSPQGSNAGQAPPAASMPPALVLEIMRILEGEMNLREETRSLDVAQGVLPGTEYADRSRGLAATQRQLEQRTHNAAQDLQALPNGGRSFRNEIGMLRGAAGSMRDAEQRLQELDCGPDTIAAETEAIEQLLQSRRAGASSSGGGGGAMPGGGGRGDTERAALEQLGPARDPHAQVEKREIRQATGATGDQLPQEFRDGLDAFFQALEAQP